MKLRLGRLLVAYRWCHKTLAPKPPVPAPPLPPPPPVPTGQHLTLVVQSANVSRPALQAYLAAQNQQLAREFAPAWGIPAYIDLAPGGWPVYLMGQSDVPGALGYHDYDAATQQPYSKVFVLTSIQSGVSWQSCASHEVLEMLADPGPNFKTATDAQGRVWDYEICDPVESTLDGTLSNFVTPAFFMTKSAGPWDQDHVLTAPFTLAPGGYAVVDGQKIYGRKPSIHVDVNYTRQ